MSFDERSTERPTESIGFHHHHSPLSHALLGVDNRADTSLNPSVPPRGRPVDDRYTIHRRKGTGPGSEGRQRLERTNSGGKHVFVFTKFGLCVQVQGSVSLSLRHVQACRVGDSSPSPDLARRGVTPPTYLPSPSSRSHPRTTGRNTPRASSSSTMSRSTSIGSRLDPFLWAMNLFAMLVFG